MRYVMVPVPRELVLEVMRWVLFRAPEEGADVVRDASRLRSVVEEAEDLTRSLLALVVTSTREGTPLRLVDAAAELGVDSAAIRSAVRRLNATALGGGRELIRVSNEPAIGPLGNQGKLAHLVMRPEHARIIRTLQAPAEDQPA